MAKSFNISDAEWDVMEVVWEIGPSTAADVIVRLSATHDWKHRTIRTLLARLVEKGVLRYEVNGPAYIYHPTASRKQCIRREGRWFLNKVFGGDVRALLVHFVSDASLDESDVAQLRRLLDAKQRKGEDR